MKSTLNTLGVILLTVTLIVFPIACTSGGGGDTGGGETADTTAPTAPTDLSATALSEGQIDLSWTASTDNVGVTGYNIYRNGTEIGSTTSTSYSDTGLAFNTFYCYKVEAYDAAGNASGEGNEECGTTNIGYNGIKWKYDTGNLIYYSSPAIASDGTIYVGDVGSGTIPMGLYALNQDGTLKWSYFPSGYEYISITHSSPAIASDGTIIVGANGDFMELPDSGRAALFAINPDGTLKWKYETNNGINWTSPAIDIDGIIYIGNNDGYLFAINSNSFGLASSTWPKFRHDNKNRGRLVP